MAVAGVELVAPTRTDPGGRPWLGAGLLAAVSIAPTDALRIPFELGVHGASRLAVGEWVGEWVAA